MICHSGSPARLCWLLGGNHFLHSGSFATEPTICYWSIWSINMEPHGKCCCFKPGRKDVYLHIIIYVKSLNQSQVFSQMNAFVCSRYILVGYRVHDFYLFIPHLKMHWNAKQDVYESKAGRRLLKSENVWSCSLSLITAVTHTHTTLISVFPTFISDSPCWEKNSCAWSYCSCESWTHFSNHAEKKQST